MPEHTNLSVAANGLVRLRQSFLYRKVLVIGTHDLCRTSVLMVKADEVLKDVNQPFLLEDTIEEGLVVGYGIRLYFTVHALPFHKAVLLGGNCSCLRYQMVTNHREGVVDK